LFDIVGGARLRSGRISMRVAGLTSGISPTASIGAGAHIGAGVSVGHGAVVEAGAYLDDGVQVGPMVVICGSVRLSSGVLVFPHAVIGADPQIRNLRSEAAGTTEIGSGTVLREGVTVHCGTDGGSTVVGAGCLVMANSHISHDCRVGDGVVISHGAGLAGHVTVGDNATIGGLAGVHQWVRIGELAMLGALAKATRDVLPMTLADGNPAEHRRVNSVGLDRHGIGPDDQGSIVRAFAELASGRDLTAPPDSAAGRIAAFLRAPSRRGVAVFATGSP
jgi:UDP-N-acetylglucosamine acyltransferase